MKYKRFEELPIWREALVITKLIYNLSSNARWSKDFGLRDQIRRAAVSISSNIVEGFEKSNNNELIRYLRIAKGSVGEVRNQLYIGEVVGYISEKEREVANGKIEKLASDIGGFIRYLEIHRLNASSAQTHKSSIRNA